MPCIRNHRLRIENVSSHAFRNCHSQIGIQSDSSYPHTRIVLIRRGEVRIIVVMVMARMASSLRSSNGSH
jgi:hypothetical protein